jgi:hypothetical protein
MGIGAARTGLTCQGTRHRFPFVSGHFPISRAARARPAGRRRSFRLTVPRPLSPVTRYPRAAPLPSPVTRPPSPARSAPFFPLCRRPGCR